MGGIRPDFIIDQAPGKELIPGIIERASLEDVETFYKIRSNWNGGPLIHDRFVTYSIFSDLMDELPDDKPLILTLLEVSIQIAEKEGNRRFCNALLLVKLFCYRASENDWIEESHREAILCLYPRVLLLSFRANLATFWEGILKHLSDEGAIDLSAYYVKEDAYKIYTPQLITYLDQQPIPNCPVEKEKLEKDLAFFEGEYEPLRLVTVAQLENIRYWVWVYRNISGNVFSFYVTVSQDEQGKITFRKHHQHEGIHTTPERLLLEEHYR
jgi:hypothetical protein